MPEIRIDLFSDTLTKPTAAMRRAMAEAEVGDEQKFEDPTVNRLQEMVADLLGKERGVFLPSGTMCNEISFAVHCRPGDEIIADRTAHPFNYEGGGPAALAGAMVRALDGERGIFTADQVRVAIRPLSRYAPRSRVLSVEQTSNLGGGSVWPLDRVREVTSVAREHEMVTHLDGARLFNAVVATGVSAQAFAAPFDSAWIDLSKGLGAPIGGVLAGSQAFIDEAWRFKQRLGGAMRQAGIVAAGGVYALEHHVDRLGEDHQHARVLAEGLAELPGIDLDPAHVETNIVIFEVPGTGMDAQTFTGRLLEQEGVRFSVLTPTTVRAVTHLDVSGEQMKEAVAAVGRLLA